MNVPTRGFHGRRRADDQKLPPGQYLTRDFPVLSAGPTPHLAHETWEFSIVSEGGATHAWTWRDLTALPAEDVTVDLHCVTRWSKFATTWQGVSLDTLLAPVETAVDHALITSYGGYTTNLPLAALRGGRAWLAYRYDGEPLAAEHGGPVRLLIPHLYLWKSAKWVRRIELSDTDAPGFWETLGYHNYGDPWREQRYDGD
jgi:DMSO/TMAO reductase YedYZ molybdopterin-dependent catalytic subunit